MAQNKTIITISGSIGSGKTSTANRVAELLGYQRFSTGGFMRKMAEDRGMSLIELSKIAEHDPTIDAAIDAELMRQNDNHSLVIDSRLGFHFLPDTFKVYIHLPLAIAVERIMEDKKNNPLRSVEHEVSRDEVVHAVERRTTSERKRYRDLYGVTVDDADNFDLVISSEHMNLEEVAHAIVNAYQLWKDGS